MPENPDVTFEIVVEPSVKPAELRRRLRELRRLDQVPGQLELPFDDDDPAAA